MVEKAELVLKRRPLAEYVKAKKRENCKVCALGAPTLLQLKEARSKKIGRPVMVEWLKDEFNLTITHSDLDSHYNGRHDE